ncbi:MAG TPA: hypothetical protein VJS69_15270, partial [Candidatus Krumholzibacteria bacterium]|nr:hypothetical protein [Candidatus Krumholzibacteria bacterium]
ARHEGSRWRPWRASSLCHRDNEKETEGSLGCAELRAAARGEMSVVVFEKQNGKMVTTDARARPRIHRFDPAVFAVVRAQCRRHSALAVTHARAAIPPIVAPNPEIPRRPFKKKAASPFPAIPEEAK